MGFIDDIFPVYPFYKRQRVDEQVWKEHGDMPMDTKLHAIGPEANVWGVGIIIYLLMTLRSSTEVDVQVKTKLLKRNPTRDDPDVDQYLFDSSSFETNLPDDEDYSEELKFLVTECTRIEPLKRPGCSELLLDIYEAMVNENDRLQEEFGDDDAIRAATRMAFTNEDWHDVPSGPYTMMPRPIPNVEDRAINRAWERFWEDVTAWCDPDAPKLIPPIQARFQPPGLSTQPTWLGTDHVMYVDRDFIADYWRGPPLHGGGRAKAVPHEENDDYRGATVDQEYTSAAEGEADVDVGMEDDYSHFI